ncbi:MAG: hypothetical protein AB2401_07050 [Bacillus sp. (in: firmicutes)]
MSALISASANRNVWRHGHYILGGALYGFAHYRIYTDIDSQLVRNRGEHGAGLGLSTVRWIVDQHQGCYKILNVVIEEREMLSVDHSFLNTWQ